MIAFRGTAKLHHQLRVATVLNGESMQDTLVRLATGYVAEMDL